MFEHSVKVPRLYKTAARIAQKVKEDGSSLKELVYEKKHPVRIIFFKIVLFQLYKTCLYFRILKLCMHLSFKHSKMMII